MYVWLIKFLPVWLTHLHESQWLFACFHGGKNRARQGWWTLPVDCITLILFSFHLLCCWNFLAEGIYIFYAHIIAFLQKSTRSNLATFIIFVSNKILIRSLKSCLLKMSSWKHRHANLASSCTFCYSRREQMKASSQQVGEKLSSECHHRCNNGLWLHCESDPENAFFM